MVQVCDNGSLNSKRIVVGTIRERERYKYILQVEGPGLREGLGPRKQRKVGSMSTPRFLALVSECTMVTIHGTWDYRGWGGEKSRILSSDFKQINPMKGCGVSLFT